MNHFATLFAGGLFGGPGLRVWGGSLDYYQGNVPVASAVTFGAECPSFSDGQFVFEPFTAAGGLLVIASASWAGSPATPKCSSI